MGGPPFKWIALTDTPEGALDKVFFSPKSRPEAAHNPTEWLIVKIVLNAEQVVDAFKGNKLMRCPGGTYPKEIAGWRFYGDLALGGKKGVAFEWLRLTLAPMGLAQWAEKVPSTRYTLRAFGTCSGCGST